MKTISGLTSGSTDRLENMIRQAGFETPPEGMTERIMHRIEVATLKKSPDFDPIIGKRGWTFIGGSAVVLIILLVLAGSIGESNGNSLFNTDIFFRSLPHPEISFRFNFQVPKPLLFGLMGLLLWFSFDFLLNTMKWNRHSPK